MCSRQRQPKRLKEKEMKNLKERLEGRNVRERDRGLNTKTGPAHQYQTNNNPISS